LSTAVRDDISVDETVAVIFAVISRVFEAEVKFKQDVKFKVNAVNEKAVPHCASTYQVILLKTRFYQGTLYMYITISVVWIQLII